MNISVCCPSYRRPIVKTLEYLPFIRVYVAPEELDAYKQANHNAEIIPCAPGIQGNIARVRNHILECELNQRKMDAVTIVDDDMTGMYYHENQKTINLLKTEDFLYFLEKHTIMAQDLGAKLWGVNVNRDPQIYNESRPFSTLSFIGGPFGCFLQGNECRYDERIPLKEDYDMTIQQLQRYRKILRINKYFYIVKQSEQSGGCAAIRNIQTEKEQLLLLQKKWGKRIVKLDTNADRSHKSEKSRNIAFFDYNPIINVPIRGI